MKNSFFLVIPAQQKNPELLVPYEKSALNQWISELPTANPGLATRLFYDFIKSFNAVEMQAQQRLDVLELLRPQFLTIQEYLRSRLILSGFPKAESEQKILSLVVSLEKHFTIGYWIVVRELTRRDVGWFKGKNAALAIQRTIKGLSGVVASRYMMFLPVPDWVWIDLHSLYQLSVKIKKEATKVVDETCLSGNVSTAEDCYKQVLLLSLVDPSGLMQKEVQQVYNFIGQITQYVSIEMQPISSQNIQCIILLDEDSKPYFDRTSDQVDTSIMYLNLTKLDKVFKQAEKLSSKDEARFSSMHKLKNVSDKLPSALFTYIEQRWSGVELKGVAVFSDRLNRHIAIGIDATHLLQDSLLAISELKVEFMAESFSDRELSCKFEKEGVLSIGSLVSYRKTNEPESKRALGIVIKITMPKQDGNIVFELAHLTSVSYAVTYVGLSAHEDTEHNRALLYGVKDSTGEKSFILMESFLLKDGDVMRMFMKGNNFPIILGDRKNIGLGFWQFECRRIEENQMTQQSQASSLTKKQGYDFI